MKCKECGKDFTTKEAMPMVVTVCYTTRHTPIKGIQDVVDGIVVWDLDFDKETTDESEIIEWRYECSFCGNKMYPDEVEEISRSYM